MRLNALTQIHRLGSLSVALILVLSLSGCYIFNFFSKSGGNKGDDDSVFTGTVLGQPLGSKAGGPDEAALASLYEISASHPPAALRPDPDLYVRRLLRQYRDEGVTVAQQIGRVEQFRLLLGGASQDFSKTPQETYDATSLLAVAKVAEEVCRALVAPSASEHPGWSSILPLPPEHETGNVTWLAQRFIGMPATRISTDVVSDLLAIMASETPYLTANWARGNAYAKYVPVCAALALDAEALYL